MKEQMHEPTPRLEQVNGVWMVYQPDFFGSYMMFELVQADNPGCPVTLFDAWMFWLQMDKFNRGACVFRWRHQMGPRMCN